MNQWKFKIAGKLPFNIEESMEYTPMELSKPERSQQVTVGLGNTRIGPIRPQNVPGNGGREPGKDLPQEKVSQILVTQRCVRGWSRQPIPTSSVGSYNSEKSGGPTPTSQHNLQHFHI